MLFGFLIIVHVLIALFLIVVILLQGGRGLFGGGANTVMAKVTGVVAASFMITCLLLAALSTARGRSVVEQMPISPEQLPLALPQTAPFSPTGIDLRSKSGGTPIIPSESPALPTAPSEGSTEGTPATPGSATP
ncbi:MAG: preprotein translocase subunit SecG [Candidatus Omnitrophica bacterium]|nr:preprotein translocase subunit SecG [Candidatus Omnitrophota bacterium]